MTERTTRQIEQLAQATVRWCGYDADHRDNQLIEDWCWACMACGHVFFSHLPFYPNTLPQPYSEVCGLGGNNDKAFHQHFKELPEADWQKHAMYAAMRNLL